MANAGKEFEKQFKESVPKGVYILRIPDSAIGFNVEESTQRFAGKTPYDFVMYNYPNMYALELKSTSGTAISFEGKTPMIKEHQIKALRKAAVCGVKAGFVFNFRKTNTTYYVPISTFDSMTNFGMMGKSSINEKDLVDYGEAVVIPQKLKKVNYAYDLSVLFG